MPVVKVKNLNNEEVGELELSEGVFGAPLNKALIYSAVKCYQANQRAGTSATKTRGDTSGSGKKLWKQKGTGRARIASLRSPLWKGGGNVHGPQPRDWSYTIPKKMRRGAICAVLSERLREGGLVVVDSLDLQSRKTKDFQAVLNRLGLENQTLLIDSLENSNLALSSRNLRHVKHISPGGVNVYELLVHEHLVFTRESVGELDKLLGRQEA
ncbi:MAG: 50S ribosomal protein L4 [Blastocatellia bacterium AA13]|nr:MAG: 50S ribosomal protein L4 [Blastocatellia bacterium AA13]